MQHTVTLFPNRKLGEISPYIYGQYFEHVENCIYPSVWDGSSPKSNETGLREDVIEAVKELGAPIVRWPGGCFADFYHWEDGIGPRHERPVRKNFHWGGLESNQFGTDEFLEWCRLVGTEPYLNLNLGTGTLDEALRWQDYCNGKDDTSDVLRRKANGHEEPYGVRYWGIGNETFGDWEAGCMDAETYGRTLANWARFLRQHQPGVKLLGVGSIYGNNPEWDRTVLKHAGRLLDYLTFHLYGSTLDRTTGEEYNNVVYTPAFFEQRARRVISDLEHMRQANKWSRPVRISMDEWNIRHYERSENGRIDLNRHSMRNLQDALFAAGIFNTMIRLSPHIGMANYVFLVNGNGVLRVNETDVLKTSLYYVFQQFARWMQGTAVDVHVDGPRESDWRPQVNRPNDPNADNANIHPNVLDAAAAVHDDGTIAVSLVNRSHDESGEVQLNLPDGFVIRQVWTLHHEHVYAGNDFVQPDRLKPTVQTVNDAANRWTCPPHSIVLLLCGPAN
ncbi:MAG: alpha-N-arabinofuranosidase [Paenibacillus sp.]|nr:alpha-N-arabinofuranosidase [Paenibacillus sp.]